MKCFALSALTNAQTPVIYGNDPSGDCVWATKDSQQQEEYKGQKRNWNLGSWRDKPETSRGGQKLEKMEQVDEIWVRSVVVVGRTPDLPSGSTLSVSGGEPDLMRVLHLLMFQSSVCWLSAPILMLTQASHKAAAVRLSPHISCFIIRTVCNNSGGSVPDKRVRSGHLELEFAQKVVQVELTLPWDGQIEEGPGLLPVFF